MSRNNKIVFNGLARCLSSLNHKGTSFCPLRSYCTSVKSPNTVEVPKDLSLSGYIFKNAETYSNKTAMIDGTTGTKVDFAQLQEEIRNLTSAFYHLGVLHRDTVTLFGTNTPYIIHVLCSVTNNGGIMSMASSQLTPGELASQLRLTRSRFVIASPDCAQTALTASLMSPYTQEVITTAEVSGFRSLTSLLKKPFRPHPHIHINPDSTTAILPFSSGTTGLPKPVMLTHTNLIANLVQLRHPNVMPMDKDDMALCCVPTVHIGGLVIGSCLPVAQGAGVVMLPKFSPRQFLSTLQNYRATFALLVPPLVSFLAKDPMVDEYDLSSLRYPFSGAASLSKELSLAFVERLKLPGLRQGYGMTETSPATHVSPLDGWKYGSIGIPLPLTRCKVLHPDTGSALGPGSVGELCVRGPQVMRGYLNDPTATSKAFTQDAWLRTGDLGYYDDDGHYFIVDRIKEIIKYKGYQISPVQLENILLSHPSVTSAAVIGVPRSNEVGEVPRAFVVTDGSVTERDLENYVSDNVSPYKKLRGGVELVQSVPISPSGKILRRHVRDKYLASLNRKVKQIT